MAKQTNTTASLVALIASATPADLEQIDAEITRIEQEIATYAREAALSRSS